MGIEDIKPLNRKEGDTGAYPHEQTNEPSPIEMKVGMDVSLSYVPTETGDNLP